MHARKFTLVRCPFPRLNISMTIYNQISDRNQEFLRALDFNLFLIENRRKLQKFLCSFFRVPCIDTSRKSSNPTIEVTNDPTNFRESTIIPITFRLRNVSFGSNVVWERTDHDKIVGVHVTPLY